MVFRNELRIVTLLTALASLLVLGAVYQVVRGLGLNQLFKRKDAMAIPASPLVAAVTGT